MVLEKGLNFSTVEQKADKISLLDDTYKFSRKLKLRAHFDATDDTNASPTNEANNTEENQVDDVDERSDMSGKMKNPYYNPPGNSPKALDLYITAIKSSIQQLFKNKKAVKDNLTEGERIALENLRNREDIVIQQADKGGKIVVMNKVDYVGACEELLKDDEYYKEENTDRSKEFANEIKGNIEEMNGLLTKKEKKFLLEDLDNTRTPVFYGLPKIHFQKKPPMKPIVSGYGSCTPKSFRIPRFYYQISSSKMQIKLKIFCVD